jgi:hypothetical protein
MSLTLTLTVTLIPTNRGGRRGVTGLRRNQSTEGQSKCVTAGVVMNIDARWRCYRNAAVGASGHRRVGVVLMLLRRMTTLTRRPLYDGRRQRRRGGGWGEQFRRPVNWISRRYINRLSWTFLRRRKTPRHRR